MENFSSIQEQSRSIIFGNEDEPFELYNPYESFLSKSIYEENELKDSINEEFKLLKEQWLEDTKYISSVLEKVNHPAYLKNSFMGRFNSPEACL
jgi:hypothetical protein